MSINNLIQQIKSKNWYFEVTRKFNWLVEWGQIQANTEKVQRKYSMFVYPTQNGLILNGDEYYLEDELDDFSTTLEKNFNKDPNFFEKFTKETFSLAKSLREYETELKATDFSGLSNEELNKEVVHFGERLAASFVPAWTRPDLYLDTRLKKFVKQELKITDSKVEDLVAKITIHSELAKLAFSEEPIALLKIAKEIQDSNFNLDSLPSKIEKKLESHVNKYSWMKNPMLREEVEFKKKEYLERVEEMLTKNVGKVLDKVSQNRKGAQADYRKTINKYKIKGRLLKICETVRDSSFLRTYTREVNERLFFVARQTILREAANRIGISRENITMLEPTEINRALKHKKLGPKGLVQKRLKGFAIIWLDGNLVTIFGQEANQIQKEVFQLVRPVQVESKSQTRPRIIKGTPASKGKARGIVKILFSHRDVNKIDRGDILVATMTTPDYIMGMEKAAAFITDEGGITCHAAIIAREFGVPCIVGTLNATKVLKDGDFVEVDANKGVLKIVKKP